MNRRNSLVLILLVATACTSSAADDVDAADEAGTTTTNGSSETTSESTTTETTSESTTTETTGSDIPPPSCDVWLQDCPAGEKCVPYDSTGGNVWNAYKCVPVLGDQQAGDPCTYAGPVDATDDCDASSICFDGTCTTQCTGTPAEPMCPAMTQCTITNEGVLVLCIPTCDPLVQDCGAGQGCYWANTNFHCLPVSEDIPTGEPCGFANDCAAGNLCVDAVNLPMCMGAACCAGYCDLSLGDADCAGQPGTVCVSFFEQGMAPPEYQDVGVCLLAP